MFILIHHKIGVQNRVSFVNTDKIIAFNPCFDLKVDKCVLFEYLKTEEYEKIPENMYFVIGDNREESKDSRDISVNLISKKDTRGTWYSTQATILSLKAL